MSVTETVAAPAIPAPRQALPPLPRGRPAQPGRAAWSGCSTPGTTELLTPVDDSGFLAAAGLIDGVRTVAYASDATIQAGAMGATGCQVILAAYEHAWPPAARSSRSSTPPAPACRKAWPRCTRWARSSRP